VIGAGFSGAFLPMAIPPRTMFVLRGGATGDGDPRHHRATMFHSRLAMVMISGLVSISCSPFQSPNCCR